MTIGDLKRAMEGLPDDSRVQLHISEDILPEWIAAFVLSVGVQENRKTGDRRLMIAIDPDDAARPTPE